MTGPVGAGQPGRAVTVRGLTVVTTRQPGTVLEELDLHTGQAEFIGLAGETGSGKTTLGLALLGFSPPGLSRAAGSIDVCGTDLVRASARVLRSAQGATIAYVPQDPSAALNPGLRIRAGFRELLRAHGLTGRANQGDRVSELLRAVGLPATAEFTARYPHQLSGGQKQRVTIAMAFACQPSVVVMDEPTTGLDAAVKGKVIELVRHLGELHGTSVILISHDIRMLLAATDRLLVMYAGRIVEDAPAAELSRRPRHPYTRRLIAALPDANGHIPRPLPGAAPGPAQRGTGCDFAPRCDLAEDRCSSAVPPLSQLGPRHQARCLRLDVTSTMDPPSAGPSPARRPGPPASPFVVVSGLAAHHGQATVTRDIELEIGRGECAALVGESGSGKTTIARSIAGLHSDYDGTISLGGRRLERSVSRRPAADRAQIQYVFQNPYASLNPRRTVGASVTLAARMALGLSRRDAAARAAEMIEMVGLRADQRAALPRGLSGGERQRAALARALACGPSLLICDEVTSSLDVSVQAGIITLLQRLQAEQGLTMLFITHDLTLAAAISDSTVVLRDGRVVESGPTSEVLRNPRNRYTRQLLAAR